MKYNIELKKFIKIKQLITDYTIIFDSSILCFSSVNEAISSINNLQQEEFICQGDDHYLFKQNSAYIAFDDELQYFVFVKQDIEGIKYLTGWPAEKPGTKEKTLVLDNLFIKNKKINERETLILDETHFHFKRTNYETGEVDEMYSTSHLIPVKNSVETEGLGEEIKIIDDISTSIKSLKKEK